MSCIECNRQEYPISRIENVCIVCAVSKYRLCRSKLNSSIHNDNDIITEDIDALGRVKCEGSFKPDFMYQMYCSTCWNNKVFYGSENDNTYSHICIVCENTFKSNRENEYLCDDHKYEWLSCDGCPDYFKPYKGRYSESYCYECRNDDFVESTDLFSIILKGVNVKLNFNKKTISTKFY